MAAVRSHDATFCAIVSIDDPLIIAHSQIIRESHMFSTNEGAFDRILRILVGIGLIAIVFIGPKTPFGWIGLVPLLTGFIGWCPLYTVLGLRTCPAQIDHK